MSLNWQDICQTLDNDYQLSELQQIALEFNLPTHDIYNSTKTQICNQLAKMIKTDIQTIQPYTLDEIIKIQKIHDDFNDKFNHKWHDLSPFQHSLRDRTQQEYNTQKNQLHKQLIQDETPNAWNIINLKYPHQNEPYEIALRQHEKDQLILPMITIDDLIVRNHQLIQNHQLDDSIKLDYNIDRQLAKYFPIIGKGTTALVFDLGTFVLKRIVDDSRDWEFDLNRLADHTTGLRVQETPVPIPKHQYDYYLVAQEKLEVIDPSQYIDQIQKLYFPQLTPEKTLEMVKYWEWGIDKKHIPHVFDWG